MAFDRSKLACVSNTGNSAPKLYTYATDDSEATVVASNYFLGAYNIIAKGDMILVSFDQDGTIGAAALTVSASTSSTVTTAYIQVA